MTGDAGNLDQRFADAMGQLLGPDFPSEIGLAVSGGGDSMAMLALAHNWTRNWGVRLWVATIDHGLRPESADEARMVADECKLLGWPHATLRWHWEGTGNKMDAARRGRLSLLDRWRGTLQHVLMAHTQDDVAETFLMRLKRGSGVDGLSAMSGKRTVSLHSQEVLHPEEFAGDLPPQFDPRHGAIARPSDMTIIRPCLGMSRSELRHYLTVLKCTWVDDPSNDDPVYDRVQMRNLLLELDKVGLGSAVLSATAHRLSCARDSLRARAASVWSDIGWEGEVSGCPTGEILIDRSGFAAVEHDLQFRLLAAALQYVSGAEYRPRAESLADLLDQVLAGGGGTLSGCEARSERNSIRIFREYKAVADLRVPHGENRLWDGRWHLSDPALVQDTDVEIRALGDEGWQQLPDRPEVAPPHRSARSLPGLWRGGDLLACSAMGFGQGATTQLWPIGDPEKRFKRFLLSH